MIAGLLPAGIANRAVHTLQMTNCTSADLAVNGIAEGEIDTTVVFTAAGTFECEIVDQINPYAEIGDEIEIVLTVDATPHTLTVTVADDPFDRRGRRAQFNTRELIDRLFPSSGDDTERLADLVARGGTIFDVIEES